MIVFRSPKGWTGPKEVDGQKTEGYWRSHQVPMADMTKPGQIADMIHAAERTFGSLDILINNAGIQHVAPIEEFPIEKWDQIIGINLSSAFHTIRAAVPGMKARKWGRIINTASAHSLVASPFKSAYVSAKHGLNGLTKTVALEVATFGITANCISPGYVWTPLVEKQIPDTMKARGMTAEQVKRDVLLAAQPTKEFVTVEEVAALAVYLCSDAAKAITGANLSIDGGAYLFEANRGFSRLLFTPIADDDEIRGTNFDPVFLFRARKGNGEQNGKA